MSGASSPFQSSTYRLEFSALVLAVLLIVLGAHAISCLSISASAVGAADSQGDSSGFSAQSSSALPASDTAVATPNGDAVSGDALGIPGPTGRAATHAEPQPCHAPSEPSDTSCVASTPELPNIAAEPAEADATVAALPDAEWTVARLLSAEVLTPSPQDLSISRT